jgi:hypothetical protein
MAEKTPEVPNPATCVHPTLMFLNGGGRIVCVDCHSLWNLLDSVGRPVYSYFNIAILYGDKRKK